MSSHFLLEAFLVFDIFLAGIVAAVAGRHGLAHLRPDKHDAEHTHPHEGGHLPPAMREKMLEEAQVSFEKALTVATHDLQKDLAATAEEIKQHVEKIGNQAESEELEHYKAALAELQSKTKEDVAGLDKDLASQKAEMKAKLAADVAAEKKQLLDAIDTKLADAVTSFLMETLQHDVDLGAQGAYLTKMLEEHKAEFIQEVGGGNEA